MNKILKLGFLLLLLPGLASSVLARRQMENLGRGVVAARTGTSSVYIGWRLLGNDPEESGFNLYRSANGGAAGAGTITLAGGTVMLGMPTDNDLANPIAVSAPSSLVMAGSNNRVNGAVSGDQVLNLTVNSGLVLTFNGNLTNYSGTFALGSSAGTFRLNSSGGNATFGFPNATIDLGIRCVRGDSARVAWRGLALGPKHAGRRRYVTGGRPAASASRLSRSMEPRSMPVAPAAPPFAEYQVLSSTNVAAPICEWQTNTVDFFDTAGNFNFSTVAPGAPHRFFRLQFQSP